MFGSPKNIFDIFHNIYIHIHADAFIQSDFQCIQAIHLLSVHVFPGNWTHNLYAANAMLYHWATGTCVPFKLNYVYINTFMY